MTGRKETTMPNHIQNVIKFKTTDEQFARIADFMSGEETAFDFDKLIPMPDGVDWYHWSIENWGTKWNSYEVEVDSDSKTIRFLTAWASVPRIVKALSVRYPNVKMTYSWADEDIGRNLGKAVFFDGRMVEKTEPERWTKEAYRMAFRIWNASPSEFNMHFSKKLDNYVYDE